MAVRFKRYATGDVDLYLVLVEDLKVMRYITERALSLNEGQGEFLDILAYNGSHQDGTGYFKVYRGEDYLGFAKISWRPERELEVGYMLLPHFWGQGLGGEILSHLLKIVDQSENLINVPVMAVIDPDNQASKYLLKKQGFVSSWQGMEDGLATEYLHRPIKNAD